MAHWRRIIARLYGYLANKRAEEDLAREVASHLILLADDFERRGMSPEEARLAARRAYGGVEQANRHIVTNALCCGSNKPYKTCAMACAH
jgi:hypothetical protein